MEVLPRDPSKAQPGDVCSAVHYSRESLRVYDRLQAEGYNPVTILDRSVTMLASDFSRLVQDSGGACSVVTGRGRRESCVWIPVGCGCHIRVYCVECQSLPEYDVVDDWRPLKGGVV